MGLSNALRCLALFGTWLKKGWTRPAGRSNPFPSVPEGVVSADYSGHIGQNVTGTFASSRAPSISIILYVLCKKARGEALKAQCIPRRATGASTQSRAAFHGITITRPGTVFQNTLTAFFARAAMLCPRYIESPDIDAPGGITSHEPTHSPFPFRCAALWQHVDLA